MSIRKLGDKAPNSSRPMRAAEYVRMSSIPQDNSPVKQRARIAEYAAANGIEIVRRYFDSGKSGLTIKDRPSLAALLSDVQSGSADFSLVQSAQLGQAANRSGASRLSAKQGFPLNASKVASGRLKIPFG